MTRWLQRLTQQGVTSAVGPQLEKRILLTNKLCLISVAVSLPYSLLMVRVGFTGLALMVALLCGAFLGCIGLNHLGHDRASRLSFLVITDLFLFFLARFLGKDSGVQLALFPSLVLSFVLFGWSDRRLIAVGLILPPVLFSMLELGDAGPPPFQLGTVLGRNIHLVLAMTAFGTLTVWVLLLSLADARSEKELSASLARLQEEMGERARIEAELLRSQKLEALGHLVAGVAHEINNPLGFVLSNLDYLREELSREHTADSWAEVREVIEETITGATRIRVIVRDLKLMVSFDAASEKAPTADVNQVVGSTAELIAGDLARVGVLALDLKATRPLGCDAGRLGQVLLNLAMNAIQAFDAQRLPSNQLRISSFDVEGGATIEVADNGPGIPPENLTRIFNPFFTTKPIGAGTGLGLSICHGIIEAAKGRLTVRSEVGRGTTFSVFLPAA